MAKRTVHANRTAGKRKNQLGIPGDGEGRGKTRNGKKGNKSITQVQRLLSLTAGVELFHSPDRTAYATVQAGKHAETWRVDSSPFSHWLRDQYYQAEKGGTPSSQALRDAIEQLKARALFGGGDQREVFLRVAEISRKIYIDLTNSEWEVVEVSADGWDVISEPPIKFRRPSSMKALPTPQRGGNPSDLGKLMNLQDASDLVLILGWLVGSLRNRGPYPILIIQGEQGTAKSTLARLLRGLVDPSVAPLRSPPRSEYDLVIYSANSWCLAFDNLSYLPPWLADGLCRLSTGGGFGTRKLYSNEEELVFDTKRPVILNGITDLAARGDVADRALVVNLLPIPEADRRTEEEIEKRFSGLAPKILGSLLDAVSMALRRVDGVRLHKSPRMADFAKWVVAAEPAFQCRASFLPTYLDNRSASMEVGLESDPVAVALLTLVEKEAGSWEGTPTELYTELSSLTPDQRSAAWPKAANALSSRIRRLAPSLRAAWNLEIDFGKSADGSRRLVTVSRTEKQRKGLSEPPEASEKVVSQDGPDSPDDRRAAGFREVEV